MTTTTISRRRRRGALSATMLYTLLLLLLVPPAATLTSRHYPPSSAKSLRADFVRAMNEATQREEETKHQKALMSRLLKVAKPVKIAFTTTSSTPPSSSSRAPPFRRDGVNEGTTSTDDDNQERKLGNNNNNYNNNNNQYYGNYNYGYYNYNGGGQYQNQNQQEEDQEEDDAFADYGGLNLTSYALKYLGCQNIHTFSDAMAADNTVYGSLAMDRFVVFRLCPKQSCSNYNDMGCEYNYGEYAIPMEDYLVTMQEYHIDRYQEYCQTCELCMTGQINKNYYYNNGQQNRNRDLGNNNYNNNNYNNGGGGQYYYYNNDDKYYGDDAAYADDMYNNKNGGGGGDDYVYDANDDQNDDGGAGNSTDDDFECYYKDVCTAYKEACGAEMYTDDNYIAYSENYAQYFECTEFDVGGAVSYLGPHCRSDGFTIGIGIYEDQYCSSYIGDMVDMQEVTGQAFDDEYLSPYYPKQCISCKASESYDLMTDDELENEENGGLYEVCGELYLQAAKCNVHLSDSSTFVGTYEQEANEGDVCNFVASLIENNYDEYGEAILESPEWTLDKWKSINSYRQDMVAATGAQIFGLIFSVGLVVVLFFYSMYLRYKLTRRLPWSRGFGQFSAANEAGQIARASSGITMQRSLSNLEPGYSDEGAFA